MAKPVVSVTFDNLGEAAQLELGMWPEEVPQGQHFTVVEVLPRLLDLLAAREIKATFFVEGLNAEMYPRALLDIVDAGHELALHAWRHEEWAGLDVQRELALLERATTALRSLGIEPRGFRPPGGGLTADTLRLLGERGYSYVSPAGEREGLLVGLAVLPFRWPLVDAYAYMPQFEGLRERYGGAPDPNTPEQMRDQMRTALGEHAEADGHLTLIFHPFTVAFTGDGGWEALDSVLGEVSRLAATGAIEVARMDAAAERLLALPEGAVGPPQLDAATWMTQ